MAAILLVARLVLAAVFVVAGIAKLADPAGSRKSASGFGVPEFLTWPFVRLLPLAEVVVGVGLVAARSAWWAAAGALALLVLFIAGISVSLARGRKPDCHCFGQLYSEPVGAKTLGRNGVLAGMAGLILWRGPGAPGSSVVAWLGSLNGFEAGLLGLGVVVALLVAGAMSFAVYLLRQNGRLMLRMEALEAKLVGTGVAPAAEPEAGLPVNTPAPAFSLAALEGGTVTLQMLEAAGKPVLLVFSEPGCGACDELLPDLAKSQRGHADRLTIVPVSRGEVEANRTKSAAHQLQNVLLQKDDQVSAAYGVTGTPSAVLIRDGAIASALAVGGDSIRALLARASLPPAVKKGDLAPELRLPDLSGKLVDLGSLRGHRTVVVFWNPGCGFCKQMTDEVKAWERSRPKDSPELLFISTGSLEENRQMGFRSRVLLDQHYAAGQVFESGGTPSAVMIDEDGRVASGVAVGAPEVMALAGATPVGAGRG